MSIHKFSLLVLFLGLLSTPRLFATHIVGGEVTYTCLGNNDFEITLVVYRDCYNGSPQAPFDPEASIGVFDFLWGLKKDLRVAFVRDDTLDIVLSDPCSAIPPNVCVHRSIYKTKVNLPFIVGGYTLVYQRCCRNQLIRNIPNPLAVGASYSVHIGEDALRECNNSARFNQWPPVAICVHKPIDFDHGATDPDGDSLGYRLCVPISGATQAEPMPQPPVPSTYFPITWLPPYSLDNLLGGQPLTIDPKSGFITGVPNTIGNFVVGVCVDEFRGGMLISTTRRDFQYNVADCGVPDASLLETKDICVGTVTQLDNSSTVGQPYRWYFDQDTTPTATSREPTRRYTEAGTYKAVLVVGSNAACSDTAFQTIIVHPIDLVTANAMPDTILLGDTTQLTAVMDNWGAFAWKPNTNMSNGFIANPTAWPTTTQTFTVEGLSVFGCIDTASVRVVVLPPLCAEPYVFFPTAFSPNDDGENDILRLEGALVEEVYWAIYNRWGEKLFEAKSLDEAWDGTYKGIEQPVETYGYYLRARCRGGGELAKQGNISLLR